MILLYFYYNMVIMKLLNIYCVYSYYHVLFFAYSNYFWIILSKYFVILLLFYCNSNKIIRYLLHFFPLLHFSSFFWNFEFDELKKKSYFDYLNCFFIIISIFFVILLYFYCNSNEIIKYLVSYFFLLIFVYHFFSHSLNFK